MIEKLDSDPYLKGILVALYRKPNEVVELMKLIINPNYESCGSELTGVLKKVLDFLDKDVSHIPTPDEVGCNKDELFSAINFIIVGKRSLPLINKIFEYLRDAGILRSRIAAARVFYYS